MEILDTKGAAEFLRLSKSYLDRARVYGGGPRYLALGRAIRYRKADLEAWANERVRTSTSEAGR
jgi:predicted DNA-binding transcriptional regulator AlpA